MKRLFALLPLLLLLSACGSAPTADNEPSPMEQALQHAEQAGLLADNEPQAPTTGLTAENALTLAAAGMGKGYQFHLSEEQPQPLTTDDTDGTTRTCYLVRVTDAADAPIGQIAVDAQSGVLYHCREDGTLDDFATLPRTAAAQPVGWAGSYHSPTGILLVISEQTEDSFVFSFSDGTDGQAAISGSTAREQDGEIAFSLTDGAVTVAGGAVTGNYTLAAEEAPTAPESTPESEPDAPAEADALPDEPAGTSEESTADAA